MLLTPENNVTQGSEGASTLRILGEMAARLQRIEDRLALLVNRQVAKDFYTVAEVALLVGRSEFTVREWARHGRLQAVKRNSGRGRHHEWVVSREELDRYQREGLLPFPKNGV
jgi:excisionase family DNA binding protein